MFSKPSSDRVGRVWREGGRLVIEYADPRLAESAVNEIRSGRFPPLPNVAVREAQAALATPEPAPALDVKRLAQALRNRNAASTGHQMSEAGTLDWDAFLEWANEIVAEYARLAAEHADV